MPDISTNIKSLEEKVWQGTPKYNFNVRLDITEIETFEKAYGIVLAESYKVFMEQFNGGMITEFESSYYIDMTEWEPDGPKWSSNYFLDLEEIHDKYTSLKLDNVLLDKSFKGIYPIIPIGKTANQEMIFLLSQKGQQKESPVFVSFDNSNLEKSEQIALDFNRFLETYLQHEGFPPIGTNSNNPLCIDYIKKHQILKIAEQEETYEEILERNSALMKLFPDDGWNYLERGNAHLNNGRRKLALSDFNKAIALNPKEAFFYHCRGDLILRYGSARKALIDLDIAVKLDPEDKMFQTGRAAAFYNLGKLDKALADCNAVLEKDGIYQLALYVRIDIYRAMGEEEKAIADGKLLDDLNL
jgi:tetratricopeptide (TPR) repeat protein